MNDKECVVIASNSKGMAEHFKFLLEYADCEYSTYHADNPRELEHCIRMTFPRIVFMEDCFCGELTEELVYDITREDKCLRVVIFTHAVISDRRVADFIVAGAESFIDGRADCSVLHGSVSAVLRGEIYRPQRIENRLLNNKTKFHSRKQLTDLNKRVIFFMSRGYETKTISKMFDCSQKQVRRHREKIYLLTGEDNPVGVVRWALLNHVISNEEFLQMNNEQEQ
jgi:DNA-binding NarL/FixJ family response regulator